MKASVTFFVCILLTAQASADLHFIRIETISRDSNYISAFNAVKSNLQYYADWANEWHHDKPKEVFIQQLTENYLLFSSISNKNEEVYLLLGDIAHYLYNLDDSAYYIKAVNNYNAAIKANPDDYRAYWFLGYHYSTSNVPVQAIENFQKAQLLLPAEQPADFWNDYAWATYLANMPSHCIFAMDMSKKITGYPSKFERDIGETLYKTIVDADKEKTYKSTDIWTADRGEKVTFTCKPLGIKISIDSTWNLSIYNYEKYQEAFIINPPTIKNKKGTAIHYTIALIMRVGVDGDSLNGFIDNMVAKYPDKTKISFSGKYDKMVAYEIKDKTMYQDIGGGHMYMIGIERNTPKYPGKLLESPLVLQVPTESTDKASFYRAGESMNRFKGKIFYAIMLDSCDDIHDASFSVFKALFENQILIE